MALWNARKNLHPTASSLYLICSSNDALAEVASASPVLLPLPIAAELPGPSMPCLLKNLQIKKIFFFTDLLKVPKNNSSIVDIGDITRTHMRMEREPAMLDNKTQLHNITDLCNVCMGALPQIEHTIRTFLVIVPYL